MDYLESDNYYASGYDIWSTTYKINEISHSAGSLSDCDDFTVKGELGIYKSNGSFAHTAKFEVTIHIYDDGITDVVIVKVNRW